MSKNEKCLTDDKIDELIKFIELQQGEFKIKESEFDSGRELGWNEALEAVLDFIKINKTS